MNDLSDEAFYKWWDKEDRIYGPLAAWQEARRRAEYEIKLAREYWHKAEGREREAFEAGWEKRGGACYPTPMGFELDCAWQAYKEQESKP